jgi:hypothetical protein
MVFPVWFSNQGGHARQVALDLKGRYSFAAIAQFTQHTAGLDFVMPKAGP